VEDLFDGEHLFVGVAGAGIDEEFAHFGLPAGVDGFEVHAGAGGGEVWGFEVADEETVGAEEERVVGPAGAAQGVEHIGPIDGVAERFYAAIRTYWPGLADGALQPGYAGIRPKVSPPGKPMIAVSWVVSPKPEL